MKIKKIYQGELPENKILNAQSTSQTDTYSCEYINNIQNNVYSTEEQVIGTYLGKPIYRKCVIYNFDGTYKENGYTYGGVHNNIGIGVIESMIRFEAHLYQPDLDRIPALPESIHNAYGTIDYRNKGMDVMQVGVKDEYKTNAVIKMTIEYTKTND